MLPVARARNTASREGPDRIKETSLQERLLPHVPREKTKEVTIMYDSNGSVRISQHNGEIDLVGRVMCRMSPGEIAQPPAARWIVLPTRGHTGLEAFPRIIGKHDCHPPGDRWRLAVVRAAIRSARDVM